MPRIKPTKRPLMERASAPSYLDKNFPTISATILTTAGLLYAILNAQYLTGVYNDDAVYVLGARSLWNHASFHSLILRPDYPMPGLPVLLAPFAKLFEPQWTHLEWVAVAMTLLAVFFVGQLAQRFLSAGEALIVVLLFAFNRFVAKFSGILMPEISYAAAALISFYLMSRLQERYSRSMTLALGAVLGWASLIRPEGLVILVSVLGPLIFFKSGRRILGMVTIPIALWGLVYLYWWKIQYKTTTEFGGDVDALKSFWTLHWSAGLRFSAHLLHDFLVFPFTTVSWSIRPDLMFLKLLGLIFLAALVGAGFYDLWKNHRTHRLVMVSIALFCGAYFLVHLFWHVAQSRYSIPLLPFWLIFLVHGAAKLFPAFGERKSWLWAAMLILLGPHFYRNGSALYEIAATPNPMKGPPWRTLAWLQEHTTPDVKVMSAIAPSVELYANRPALPGLRAGNIEMFLYRMNQAHLDYIVDRFSTFVSPMIEGTDDPNRYWNLMHFRLDLHPKYFKVVFEDPQEETKVYHVVIDPRFVQAYQMQISAYADYLAGRLDEALRKGREGLKIYPELGSSANLLGAIYWKRGDMEQARSAFLQAVERMPGSTHPLLNLATLYRQAGDQAVAQQFVQRALSIGAARGDQELAMKTVEDLQRQWQKQRGVVFMDAP